MYAKEKRWELGNFSVKIDETPVHGCVGRDCIYASNRKTIEHYPSPYTGYKITFEYDGESCECPDYPRIHSEYISNLTRKYERKCAEKPYSRQSRTKYHNEWIEGVRQFRCPLYQGTQEQPTHDEAPITVQLQLTLV